MTSTPCASICSIRRGWGTPASGSGLPRQCGLAARGLEDEPVDLLVEALRALQVDDDLARVVVRAHGRTFLERGPITVTAVSTVRRAGPVSKKAGTFS